MIWISSLTDLLGFCRNWSTSSAYKLFLYLCVYWCIIGVNAYDVLTIAAANGSKKSGNNEGESGHPCLVPL